MKKFDFYQDVKVTVWQRQHFTIEAETAEEARELVKKYADKDISTCDEVEADEIEWLYDTEEHISPEENGGCATIEVYECEGKYKGTLIADNAPWKKVVKVGTKCKWNDPAIDDYPKKDRKKLLDRVFTIEQINGEVILISDDEGTEAEVFACELELLD